MGSTAPAFKKGQQVLPFGNRLDLWLRGWGWYRSRWNRYSLFRCSSFKFGMGDGKATKS